METDKERFDRMGVEISNSAKKSMKVQGVSEAIDRIDARFELASLHYNESNLTYAIVLRAYVLSSPDNPRLRRHRKEYDSAGSVN